MIDTNTFELYEIACDVPGCRRCKTSTMNSSGKKDEYIASLERLGWLIPSATSGDKWILCPGHHYKWDREATVMCPEGHGAMHMEMRGILGEEAHRCSGCSTELSVDRGKGDYPKTYLHAIDLLLFVDYDEAFMELSNSKQVVQRAQSMWNSTPSW